jgi:uncharacterized protein YigE (DUF2233 family)
MIDLLKKAFLFRYLIIIILILIVNIINSGSLFHSELINGYDAYFKIDTVPIIQEKNKILRDSLNYCEIKILKLENTLNELNSELKNIKNNYHQISENLKKIFGVNGNRGFRDKFRTKTFDCYEVTLHNSEIILLLKDELGYPISSLSNIQKIISQTNKILVFASNAGMYNKEQDPQGLFIQKGKVITNIDKKTGLYGNFYLQPNGVFFIDTCNTAGIIQTKFYTDEFGESLEYATQSGPMLVINNEVNSIFKEGSDNINIRNGVGINENGIIYFVISNEKVNFYDFALFFKDKLKCSNALYLDGAISETYLPEIGRFQSGGMFGPMIAIVKK